MRKILSLVVAVLSIAFAVPASAQQVVCLADAAGGCSRVADGQGAVVTTGRRATSWTCGVAGQAATLLECKAAAGAGSSHYITDIVVGSSTTTAGTYAIQSGTGTNCGTATAAVFPSPPATTASRFASMPTTSPPGDDLLHDADQGDRRARRVRHRRRHEQRERADLRLHRAVTPG